MSVVGKKELARSFGRCAAGTSQVYKPKNVKEVNEVFDIARASKSPIAIRGGGHSFDGQAVHDGDNGSQIILSSDYFEPKQIKFDTNTVTLGASVQWGDFVAEAISQAKASGGPIRIPGSMQTGRKATVAGTLSGDCLSRFSGIGGKESLWIESFRILTPTSGQPFEVTAASDHDLFYAVIGGNGYIGFVTDATYKLIEIDPASLARSTITTHLTFHDLIQKQLQLVHTQVSPRAISSAWFTELPDILAPDRIKGAVFDSSFAPPSQPPLPGFPLYSDISSEFRYWVETMWARDVAANLLIHELLFAIVLADHGLFENDLLDFLFFMDGNTVAKEKFEERHPGQLFPIVQQTFVVPTDQTEAFATNCMAKMRARFIRPTECDMLFVPADECFMSGSYHLDGFAVTLGFEPVAPKGCPPAKMPKLLRELCKDCLAVGGRIHSPKNLQLSGDVFRQMFSPQITTFENVKRTHDPEKLLGNRFSDTFFQF
jgi:decaprenylphospho-beta-D-ribofuranose 2-oxidase